MEVFVCASPDEAAARAAVAVLERMPAGVGRAVADEPRSWAARTVSDQLP